MKIKPYEKNAKEHTAKQIRQIANSIKRFGCKQPLVVSSDGTLIVGHGRFLAFQSLGISEFKESTHSKVGDNFIPIVVADDLTKSEIDAYRLADNKLNESRWNMDFVIKGLKSLSVDLSSLTGFDLDLLISEDGKDDLIPEFPIEPKSRLGDIYQLGEHRLLCGDATKINDVEKLMGKELADLVCTDPPYNVNYEGDKIKKREKIKNDSMKAADFFTFLYDAFVNYYSVMKKGAAIYIAHSSTEGLNFYRAFAESGFKISGCLIWKKHGLMMGRSDYQWQHEPILYGWKEGAPHFWKGGRKQATILNEGGVLKNQDGSIAIDTKLGAITIRGENLEIADEFSSVIEFDKPSRNDAHPTMKPVELISRFIMNSSQPNALVLDLFGGSGSTMIACEKYKRRCYMMELDLRYCDVVVQRWENYTGKKASLLKV